MGTALMEVLGADHNVVGGNSDDFDANILPQLRLADHRFTTDTLEPDVVINCVAFMSIDRCEVLRNKALRINTLFPTLAASKFRGKFVHFL